MANRTNKAPSFASTAAITSPAIQDTMVVNGVTLTRDQFIALFVSPASATPAPVAAPAKAKSGRKARIAAPVVNAPATTAPAASAPASKPAAPAPKSEAKETWATYMARTGCPREVLAAAHKAGKARQVTEKATGYKAGFNAHLASVKLPAYYA
jgi:flavoprotein